VGTPLGEPGDLGQLPGSPHYGHEQRDLRIQYLLAADGLALRPKRPGIAWQQMRASVGMLIEGLRIFQRAGWGANPPLVISARETGGGKMVERLLQVRLERRAAAGAPTGSVPPVVLVPSSA